MQFDYAHDGGSCPIDGSQIVQVQFRNGKMASEALPASKWRWSQWLEGCEVLQQFKTISYQLSIIIPLNDVSWERPRLIRINVCVHLLSTSLIKVKITTNKAITI